MTRSPQIHAVRAVLAITLAFTASPAAAQWTRVEALPASNVLAVRAKGDTLVAGTFTIAYVSVDAGASWLPTAQPVAGLPRLQSVLMHNGRFYVGTAGSGVFVSDDRGQTWQAFNQGLVGGLFDSQLDVGDLVVRGDSLYAATFGAGVYVRRLAAGETWHHFGEVFEPAQASNVNTLALGGTRLLAMAGGNGSVFFREPGAPEWTESLLNNAGLSPGFQASSAAWTGTGWVVGVSGSHGVFRSTQGQEPWTFLDLGFASLIHTALALDGHRVYGAFEFVNQGIFTAIESSDDDGASWDLMDILPATFAFRMTVCRNTLFAGRPDGLWRRSTPTAAVPPAHESANVRFAIAGRQPVTGDVRFRVEMPVAAAATIEIFDVGGRRVADLGTEAFAAGVHEVAWSARDLRPGVYAARLTAGDRQAVARLVRVR